VVAAIPAALARQTWSLHDYEIIFIDNNTADPALWQPVGRLCATPGPQFQFVQVMHVCGAKAGALNIVLTMTRPDATHVITVGADYVVVPQFLSLAARALVRTGADYLQLPQASRHTADAAPDVNMGA